MQEFMITSDGYGDTFEAADAADARAYAEAWLAEFADEPLHSTECMEALLEGPGLEPGGERIVVACDPAEPPCEGSPDHDLVDDGGPWSHGAEVIYRQTCRLCGASLRSTSGWRDPHTGWRGVRVEWILPGDPGYTSDRPTQLNRAASAAHYLGEACADEYAAECAQDVYGDWSGGDPTGWWDSEDDYTHAEEVLAEDFWLVSPRHSSVRRAFSRGFRERAHAIAAEREQGGAS